MTERCQSGITLKFENAKTLFSRKTMFSQVDLIDSPEFGRVLLMDNEVQFAETDEHRYHEMLIHPILDASVSNPRVLVLGGGDGIAAREILKWNPQSITIVDWDHEFMEHVAIRMLMDINRNSLINDKVHVIHMNALTFVRNTDEQFDVIVVDLPDPEGTEMIQLYVDIIYASQRCLSEKGSMVLHIGPLGLQKTHPCWNIVRTFGIAIRHVFGNEKKIRFRTAHIPSFVHPWGFLYVLPEINMRASLEKIADISLHCKYWRPSIDAHVLHINVFYIGDPDISTCVASYDHVLSCGCPCCIV